MKQTVVEQLGIAFRQWSKDWDNFEETGKDKPVSYDEFMKPFLEMEKQQRGYSKENMKQAYLDGCELKLSNQYHVKEWFEQFKNKRL